MLKLRDIMTRDVLCLSPETTLREAIETLASRHVSGAPVVARHKVVGVVSLIDVLDYESNTPQAEEDDGETEWEPFVEESADLEGEDEPPGTFFTELWDDSDDDVESRFEAVSSATSDPMGEHTVSEVMERQLHALSPEAGIGEAADEMRRAGIHRVLVMEGDSLVGIVTTMDITKAVADRKLFVKRYVFDRGR